MSLPCERHDLFQCFVCRFHRKSIASGRGSLDTGNQYRGTIPVENRRANACIGMRYYTCIFSIHYNRIAIYGTYRRVKSAFMV